jgi:histidinol-phosphate aminotransferase
MSPTPVTFVSPTAPAGYSWEATDEEVAARYGLPLESIARFDLNTSPSPPELAAGILAAGRFERPLCEYPPSDYLHLTAAAAGRYGVAPEEILVGAGADEILDLVGKAFLAPGAGAVIPTPTYAMYRVITEQRGGHPIVVPRSQAAGWALDVGATRAAARDAAIVWLCSPNNPTGVADTDQAIEALLAGLAADALVRRREAPIVVIDEAYAEFAGHSLVELRLTYPRLVVVRTASKAYALAGLRVGFAIARPEVIAAIAPYRPPGSVSVVSLTIVTAALADDDFVIRNVARVATERGRLADALGRIGWLVRPSIANFLLVGFGSAQRAAEVTDALLERGLVPRTFGAGHPLADHLRLTVRSATDNDRLIAAATEIEATTGPARLEEVR